ncbi:hypothetical protein JTE90_005865 [Oedothorax gibbosus]|uniref:Peptidase S1 domain-containing protein n=1 Tax=Oedothorax gibbosus TaxID=931172 RepID=A0AAV6URA4_9ARAC|nr:hypothetical protein JTE90_005865 [Oedothorax gibbosus]
MAKERPFQDSKLLHSSQWMENHYGPKAIRIFVRHQTLKESPTFFPTELLSIKFVQITNFEISFYKTKKEIMIHGIKAEPGLFTFMAALSWSVGDFRVNCTGFVISPTAIMSAAHCLHSSKRDDTLLQANYSAILGSPDRTKGQLVQLKAIMHPKYNRNTKDNDISILKPYVDGDKLPHMDYIQPVYLPNKLPKPEVVYAMGWGKTTFDDCVAAFGETSNILLYHQQRVVKLIREGKQIKVEGDNTDSQGSSTCQGDSGGPLVEIRGDDTMVAIGILSGGFNTGDESYQQIAPHKRFILQHAPDAQFI